MRMLGAQSFEEIRRWMYRNARPLELARWQYHMENGTEKAVLHALSVYQNEDGGFGHALEADNWNPNSSPYSTGTAIQIFRELGIYNPNHGMVSQAFAFLDSNLYPSPYGWPFTIPTNNRFPHAPWWSCSEENNHQSGYHAAGGLAGYILRCGDQESSLYHKALQTADGIVDKLLRSGTTDIHEIGIYASLLTDILSARLTDRFDYELLHKHISQMVDHSIERNPENWPRYSMRPSHYIRSPESLFYKGNEVIMEQELDFILSSRQPNGVWPISWQWDGYPNEFAIAERWWQGHLAISNVLLLHHFGRLEKSR